jgi:hypothetical protein
MPRVWRRAALVGGALAVVVFAYVVLIGRTELTAAPTGNFYDLQVRAWFDGHWDIHPIEDPDDGEPRLDPAGNPQTPLSIEAIFVDGRAYLYYGPVPALLRVPLLAATDALDGETAQISMLAALVVALAASSALHWRVRCLVRGRDIAAGSRDAGLAGVMTFVVGAGTVLLYLGSQPTVYHEATLWGLAFALWAYVAVLDVQQAPSVRSVAWASAWTTLALLTRVSVGAGPLVALGLVLLVMLWRVARDHRSSPGTESADAGSPERRIAVALAVACLVPAALYLAVNQIKFGEPWRLPLEKQVFSQIDPQRRAALEANDGSLFSAGYVPSTVWQYVRPDALEMDALAPWINFPREQATVFGEAVFDTRDETSSVPATMPLWTALAVVGAVAIGRSLVRREARFAIMVIPVVGAAAGTIGVLTIGFIAHRYLGDLFPLVALLGLVGVEVVAEWSTSADRTRARAAAAGLVVLALWGVATNLALGLEYQRLIAPVDEHTRTAFVAWQHTLAKPASGWEGRVVGDVDDLADVPGERGDMYVIVAGDRCRSVAWSDGFSWSELPDGQQVCDRLPAMELHGDRS